jgi:hypothetical protein
MVSLNFASWNRMADWLRAVDSLRHAAFLEDTRSEKTWETQGQMGRIDDGLT